MCLRGGRRAPGPEKTAEAIERRAKGIRKQRNNFLPFKLIPYLENFCIAI